MKDWEIEFEKRFECGLDERPFRPTTNELKFFISNLLAEQRKEIIEEVEKKKEKIDEFITESNHQDNHCRIEFNSGLETAKQIINKLK